MMKGLKRGIVGLLVGQAIGVFNSKPTLKKKFTNAQGTDKAKIVIDELVKLNKGLIDSVDLESLKSDISFRIEHLQDDLESLRNNRQDLSQDKIKQRTSYLATTTKQLKSDVQSYVGDLDEKHQLTDKLTTLSNHISDLQTKLKD